MPPPPHRAYSYYKPPGWLVDVDFGQRLQKQAARYALVLLTTCIFNGQTVQSNFNNIDTNIAQVEGEGRSSKGEIENSRRA